MNTKVKKRKTGVDHIFFNCYCGAHDRSDLATCHLRMSLLEPAGFVNPVLSPKYFAAFWEKPRKCFTGLGPAEARLALQSVPVGKLRKYFRAETAHECEMFHDACLCRSSRGASLNRGLPLIARITLILSGFSLRTFCWRQAPMGIQPGECEKWRSRSFWGETFARSGVWSAGCRLTGRGGGMLGLTESQMPIRCEGKSLTHIRREGGSLTHNRT